MADVPVYFYETEIEWIGAKDLQISSGKLPGIAAGAPPEFKGREGVWAPEHLFVAAFNTEQYHVASMRINAPGLESFQIIL
jgi:hypothetical protein